MARRVVMASLIAGAAGFVAFGPRGAKEDAGGRIVLDYWEKWTGLEAVAMREIVDRFNRSQDRIFVRYLTMAGIDQKALVAIAGGDPPDLVGLWSYSIPVFSESNALTPLDDLATDKLRVNLDDYASAFRPIMRHPVVSGGRVNWKTWGVINTGGTLALYYNKAMFRAAGLDPERPPRTIEELDAISARLVERDGERLTRAGFMHTEPGWWTFLWGYQFGGSLWDAATENATVTGQPWQDAYAWVQRSVQAIGLSRWQQFQEGFGSYDAPDNAFLAGKLGMVAQGPWLANVIKAYKPDMDYGVAPFPVPESIYREREPIAVVDCDVLVIPKGVKHPEASFEFLCFTQRPENVEYLATIHTKGSPMARASDGFVRNHPNRGVAVHNALAQSPRATGVPRSRVWTQLKAEFDTGGTQIRRLERPAGEILADVQRRSQDALDRYVASRQLRGGPGRGVINTEAGA